MVAMATQDYESKTLTTTERESAHAASRSNATGKRNTLTDFLGAKFAACEQKMGISRKEVTTPRELLRKLTIAQAMLQEIKKQQIEEGAKLKKAKKDTTSNSLESSSTSCSKSEAEEEEDEAYATFTYLMILTAVYLPFLLFLWIRRNIFGTASLVRSLFLGHMLRFGVAFMLLPPSTIKSFLPERAWNFSMRIRRVAEKFWNDKRTQAMIPNWVHVILSVILGVQTDTRAMRGGALEKAKSKGLPLSLIGLGVFTVLAFLVNPDGLTWIILEQIHGFMYNFASQGAGYVQGVRDGTIKITLSEISTALATAVIIVTIVNSIRSNRKKGNPQPQRERTNKQKHKKGKKGRGRHSHQAGLSSNNKNKIRGGHFRSSKEMFQETEEEFPLRSRSLSPSESRRARSMSDTESSIVSIVSDTNTAVSDAPKVDNKMNVDAASIDRASPREQSSVPKLEAVMQIPEDDKSCASSVATAQTNTTEGSSRKMYRKNKGKRGLEKNISSAPSTPRESRKTRFTNTATVLSSPIQHKSEGERVHNSFIDKKNVSTTAIIRKTSDESAPKKKEERSNTGHYFTAPKAKHKKSKADATMCLDENMRLKNAASSPISVSRDQLSPLVPLAPVQSANNATAQRINLPPGLGTDGTIMLENQNLSLENEIHLNSHSLFISPAKMELQAFLSRVGIGGSIFAALMMNLENLDSFALFNDADYRRYGIGSDKRCIIVAMLERRKLNLLADRNRRTVGWNSAVARPPPGLSAPTHNAVVGGSIGVISPAVGSLSASQSSSLPYFSSTTASISSNYSLTPGSSMNSFSVPLSMPMPQIEAGQLRERTSTLESGRNITLPPISPIGHSMLQQPGHSPDCLFYQRPNNDEEIEANLQELGGQMAGSILDF